MDYFNYTDHSGYNQSNQPPYRPKQNNFGLASCVCGLLALVTMCTGTLALIFGSLSIIFAFMGHRKGKTMDTASIAGTALSSVALLFVAFILFFAYMILPNMLRDEAFYQQMSVMYENMYDQDFDSFIEQYYDLGPGESDS